MRVFTVKNESSNIFLHRKSYNVNNKIFTLVRTKSYDPSMIVLIHHDLCDAIEMVNTTYTFPLNFAFFHFFLLNLFAIYNHVRVASGKKKNLGFVLCTDGPWIVFNFIFQSFMIHLSSETTRQVNETAVIASKIAGNPAFSKNDQELFRSFLLQNQYRNFKLKTSFFTINWKLLLTVR